MPRKERIKILSSLQEKLGSPVIAYVTGDRRGLETQIAEDALRFLYVHLEEIGDKERINLFLYTRGGATKVSPQIVSLFREYCKQFYVLIPYKAHSGGTLIACGADGILMGKMGQLSPIDPSTANPFNPSDPRNPHIKIPMSVEDVRAFIELAKERIGLSSEDKMLEVLKALTNQFNTLSLGNVQRVHGWIRKLARELLELQMKTDEEKRRIDELVRMLTEKYPHEHLISREDAKKMGLKIIIPTEDVEKLMWQLYQEYEKDAKLLEPFNPELLLGDRDSTEFTFETAYIESINKCHVFIQAGEIKRIPIPIQPISPSSTSPTPPSVVVKFKIRQWKEIIEEGGGK